MNLSLVGLWGLLTVGIAEPPTPVAMVLTMKGVVSLERDMKSQNLRVMKLLAAGDVLQSGDGEAVLVFLQDGHREQLKPRSKASVRVDGCTPASSVDRLAGKELSAKQLEGLRELAKSGRASVIVIKPLPPTVTVLTPMEEETILTDRPTLRWRKVDKADRYKVQLLSEDGKKVLFLLTTSATEIRYPESQLALLFGKKYSWRVSALAGEDEELGWGGAVFSTATKDLTKELAGLKSLIESQDVADWLMAGLTYEAHGVHGEALKVYEKLAEKVPNEAFLQWKLFRFYDRAWRTKEAEAAKVKAEKLGEMAAEK